MLGRGGVLVLNGVAAMSQLPEIEEATPKILAAIDFNPGHRYADFNPKSDKIAGYGLAALVASTAAAAAVKLGFFKALGGSDLRGQEVYHHQRDCDRGISSEAGLSESKHRHDYFRTASIIPRASNLSLGD